MTEAPSERRAHSERPKGRWKANDIILPDSRREDGERVYVEATQDYPTGGGIGRSLGVHGVWRQPDAGPNTDTNASPYPGPNADTNTDTLD